MKSTTLLWIAASASLVTTGCDNSPQGRALRVVDADGLSARIETLASDAFEGRGPSSPGEERTIQYLREAFANIGLAPGNGDSYFQEVPLVETIVTNRPSLTVRGGGVTNEFVYGDDYVGWTKRVTERSSFGNSPVVFVGYGIVAPEYAWNDYEGMDVRGRTVLIVVNDPGFATQDDGLFNGNSMTYYGRWTYKFEEAARQGAAAAIIIHETAGAGYGWDVVEGSWMGSQFDLVADDNNMSRAAVEGWITGDAARTLFGQAGLNLDELKQQAATRGFSPIDLGLRASSSISNQVRRSTSNNVLGLLRGSERPDEYVVYMAHWDHLGRNSDLQGDQIFNGAEDNASGTAGMLELAEAFATLDPPPARSVLFVAVTAEEQGLLGSAYYGSNPVYPTSQTVAAINMDVLNTLGRMNDITVIGYGNSELDDYIEAAAAEQGRVVRADPEPEKGYYYRSDHFSFAKVGVPALYADPGIDHVEYGERWTLQRRAEYTAERYHKPADHFNPDWDLTGAIDDLHLMFSIGYRLANESTFPNWREGTEFRALRDADRAEGTQ